MMIGREKDVERHLDPIFTKLGAGFSQHVQNTGT
jgi:hypothetical protein